MSRREKISAVDTAWLRMDRPGNLMMICGVLLLQGHVPLHRLKHMLEERFLTYARFRQRPVQYGSVALWEDDPAFDMDRHVVAIELPRGGGKRELQTLASRLAAAPLDPAHPLWQYHLVEHYDGGSAIVMRMHHCYADGIALIGVLLAMTDSAPNGPPAMPLPAPRRASREGQGEDNAGSPMGWLTQPLSGVLDLAGKIGSTVIDTGVELWANPLKALELTQKGTALTAEIAKLALMAQDSPTRFKGMPTGRKHCAWAEPIRLDEVKAVGKALGASVNDVLLSCVAGALGSYLDAKGDGREGLMVRALVPVNLRAPHKAHKLGNQFGLVFLELPIGIRNPIERLYALRANMRALKGSYQPVLALGILAAMGAGPKMLQDQLLEVLARNASAVMTNVPGPQQPLYFAGARLRSLMFWVPQSGNIGIGASIISFNGSVQFGLITDHALCPDPARVVAAFENEFETLVLATLMSPWPFEGDLDPAVAAEAAGVA